MLIPPQMWKALELTQEELADKEAYLLSHRNDRHAPYTQSTLRSFRHTFATRARREGMDTKTLQVLDGWLDRKTLENRYDHMQEEDAVITRRQITEMYTRKPAGQIAFLTDFLTRATAQKRRRHKAFLESLSLKN